MGQQQSTAIRASSQSPDGTASRLYYLDNFRTYLTALVIYHHTAIPYGGLGNGLYRSSLHTQASSPSLVAFNVLNQSYFMGSFFFLSGYFSSRTLQRKKPAEFLKTKAVKLGVPVVVYTLLGAPIFVSLTRLWSRQPLEWSIWISHWSSLRGVRGHVWYAATLLVFDFVEVVRPVQQEPPTDFALTINLGLDIVSSFLIRFVYPVGAFLEPLRLQPAFLPQYISAYRLGASTGNLRSPPTTFLSQAMRNGLFTVSTASTAVAFGIIKYGSDQYSLESFLGGRNLASFTYCVWNETTGYVLGTFGLQLFRNTTCFNKSWGGIGKYSYAAFLVHMTVVSISQMVSDGWIASGVVKTAVIGTTSMLASWTIGWGLSKIPLIRSVVC